MIGLCIAGGQIHCCMYITHVGPQRGVQVDPCMGHEQVSYMLQTWEEITIMYEDVGEMKRK